MSAQVGGEDRTADADGLPPGLRTARLVVFLQGGIGIFNGVLFVLGGPGFAIALGLSGAPGTAAVVSGGVVLTAASGLVIWAARLLGVGSSTGRRWVLAYEYLSVALGVLTITDVWQAGLRIALAGVVLYYLQVDRETRSVFGPARSRPPTPPSRG